MEETFRIGTGPRATFMFRMVDVCGKGCSSTTPSRIPMVVRPATSEDARAIATIHVLGWQAAYQGIVPASSWLRCQSISASVEGQCRGAGVLWLQRFRRGWYREDG